MVLEMQSGMGLWKPTVGEVRTLRGSVINRIGIVDEKGMHRVFSRALGDSKNFPQESMFAHGTPYVRHAQRA